MSRHFKWLFVWLGALGLWAVSDRVSAKPAQVTVSRGAAEVRGVNIDVSDVGARLEFDGGLTIDAAAGARLSYFGQNPVWLDAGGKQQAHLLLLDEGGFSAEVHGTQAPPAVFRTPQKLVSVLRRGVLGAFVAEEAVFADQGADASIGRRDGWARIEPGQVIAKRPGCP